MATHTVYFRGSYDEARAISRRLARIMAGEGTEGRDIARGVNLAVGMAALSDIKSDFVRKSRGGTGEDGVKWEPLKPATIAGRRATIADLKRAREGKVKLSERQVEILRDTGILLNSLSPGQLGGGALPSSYSPPAGDGGAAQILRTVANGAYVGTTVPYAAVHQHGSESRNIPARPFLPHRIPDKWARKWLRVANQALAIGARLLFERSIR